ncbi:Dihydrolipoyllysine-residue acetyltransferase component of acetoin cleaving system [Pseudoruegeria aquimaris]|uniref:Dihydrolipoyllysine-residue acetyltransferase component of acetoin cleaving system n=1 Tax=Pseudoruegeria aquimaris TaxID=393663 RepID=A0A1Y5RIV0_9RHOB|nr:alpha/beta hydrolase [Pseudoruegeria aquimaris]SLN18618.1 Dihydrolipoyllysine-residue acetyltransferase component of acetoin cleaving system [Pseudoruegeria aquimaris]
MKSALKILLPLLLAALVGCGAYVDQRAATREAAAEAAYPPIGRLIDVEGTQVHAFTAGQGPDLIFVHGASGNLRDFTFDLVDRLKGRYRVTVFDRPGLGYTNRLPAYAEGFNADAAESPSEQAILLDKAAKRLGIERAIVLGQSYGGAVALAWAVERPRTVQGVVLVSAVTTPWETGLGGWYALMDSRFGKAVVAPLLAAYGREENADRVLGSIFAPQDPPEGYESYVGVGLTLRRDSLVANAEQVNDLLGHVRAIQPHYAAITAPIEAVHGTADEIVPYALHAEGLEARLPSLHMTTLEGIGHMPHHVAPEAVIAAVDRAAARAGVAALQ